ncbi:MAG: hypothetical protein ACLTZT_08915 [Butyricimonas faecalis]
MANGSFLAKFKEIKRFVTRVDGKSGSIEVELPMNTRMGLSSISGITGYSRGFVDWRCRLEYNGC